MVSVLILAALSPAHARNFNVPNLQQPTMQSALNAGLVNGDTITVIDYLPPEGELTAPAGVEFSILGGGWGGTSIEVPDTTTLTVDNVSSTCVDGAYAIPAVTGSGTVEFIGGEFQCYLDNVVNMTGGSLTVLDTKFTFNVGVVEAFGTDVTFDNVTVDSNLSITNDNAVLDYGGFGVVNLYGGGSVDIRSSDFLGNSGKGSLGGGLYIAADDVYLEENVFANNVTLYVSFDTFDGIFDAVSSGDSAGFLQAYGWGSGAYIQDYNDSEVLLFANDFGGNLAWSGAGLYMQDVQRANLYNNLFAENWAYYTGGGMVSRVDRDFVLGPSNDPSDPDNLLPTNFKDQQKIINNTFVRNSAGLTQTPEAIVVIGAGGGASIHGHRPDFRNNIVSHTYYGGGILLHDGDNFNQGDDLNWEYNLWYWNCDVYQCQPADLDKQRNVTSNGEESGYPLHPNNIVELDPQYYYFGDVRENVNDFDYYPDVLCTDFDSPAVRNGDPNEEQPTSIANTNIGAYSDMGICGGQLADYRNPDRDGDNFEAFYDCLDEAGHPAATETFPGANEDCDFEDNDCDGTIDEGFVTTYYDDADGDGFGDIGGGKVAQLMCPGDADPTDVSVGGDCDDSDPNVNEGAAEICDGIDNDCDNIADQGELGYITVYRDTDGDGFGAASAPREACFNSSTGAYYEAIGAESIPLPGTAWVDNATDCDDTDPTVNPNAVEDCSVADRNCNGDSFDADDAPEYFIDIDLDTYGAGEPNTGTHACDPTQLPELSEGVWVVLSSDCNESDPNINPGAAETCDGFDNDCDTRIDIDPEDAPLLYEDYDNDGYGNPATALRSCDPGPSYTTTVGGDCDDSDPTVGECSECGCQATPSPAGAGGLLLLLTGVLGLRRRRA